VQESADIKMVSEAEHAAQVSDVVTKAEFDGEIKRLEHALVANNSMVIDGMKTQTTTMTTGMTTMTTRMTDRMTVVADTVTHTLEVVLKAFAEKHVAMIHDMMEQEKERVDQDMIDLRKTMHKQMKKNNAKRDANDIERDTKDAQRDALIVALQGELYNVKKRVAGVTNQDGTAPKMQRT